MKRFPLYIIILYSVLALTGCNDTLNPPEEVKTPLTPLPEAERTVIIYMAAQNSLYGAAKSDTTEMILGKAGIPEDVNVVVYIDDYNIPSIYHLTAKGGMRLWKHYEEERCSTDSLTMLETLREIEHYFPARHYGITFWSHASGWVPKKKTFGADNTTTQPVRQDDMGIPTMAGVLEQLPKCDYIFFDACFMQCIEVAYELRNVTEWLIGSPAEIPGPGAPYDKIMSALCQGDVEGIVRNYDSAYPLEMRDNNGLLREYYRGVILSCIDCKEVEPLAHLTAQMLIPLYMGRTSQPVTGFQPYATRLSSFPHFYDMQTTMFRLLSDSDYATWYEAFNNAVPLRLHSATNTWTAFHCDNARILDPEHCGGVSMFVPRAEYESFSSYDWNTAAHKTSWYSACGWEDTGW